MSLRTFLDSAGTPNHAIAVLGDDAEDPLGELLETSFTDSEIDVQLEAGQRETGSVEIDDTVVAVEGESPIATDDPLAVLLEDGTPVASSPLSELYETVLAINSDLFITGARGLGEIELPDLLTTLTDTRLRLRGYPLSHKEKLLLILLSRYIEQTAWEADSGTIRSSFQHLERLEDELGTRRVYERLADTGVDVHLYGMAEDEVTPAAALDATVHTGSSAEYRDGWFVVHRPPDPTASDATPAALVCLEVEPRIWDSFWTFDPETVVAVDNYIASTL
ncbi:DICT sensory domain-containing protein [Natronolimnobius baerhuensis]|uniref:Histidine kinase n=1 Tax=Natronolimnobius baerhuensis TaxID=253108 RepID=A0A202EBA8_9EURY|nr:DICT sensory domain-containing protein [Natronolimnobius baerhuensis]OVE85525.1 histidine kinase [Natronolimnobius baerhuensis]